MGFIRAVFGFIIAIALTAFAIANRQSVPLTYSPLHDPLNVPLYFIALGFLAAGFILGAIIVWVSGGAARRTGRKQRKTIKALEKDLAKLEHKAMNTNAPPAAELFPALPEPQNSSIKNG